MRTDSTGRHRRGSSLPAGLPGTCAARQPTQSEGEARDYYYENSHGAFEPIFDVYGPVTLSEDQAYYGANSFGDDIRPHIAVKEGCEAVDSQFDVDFSQYDYDGDGEVELVFMYYAGRGENDGGGRNCIWPHQWELSKYDCNLRIDGKKIDSYACTNEIAYLGASEGTLCSIGTACHEFAHAVGLPDFYDTDAGTNGNAGGLYTYSPMCSGMHNNRGRTPPYFTMEERMMLGWLDDNAYREFSVSGNYSLTSVDDQVAFRTPTDVEGEYFVYECRSKTGWDSYIQEAGLIVYHVDKSDRIVSIDSYGEMIDVTAKSLWDDWEETNAVNENGSHPCFYIIPAGNQASLNVTGTFSKFDFPGAANATSFVATSWNGVESPVKLSDITYSDNTVSFYATVLSNTLNYNVIANPGNGVYAAGSRFGLSLVPSDAQPVSAVEWYFDDEPVSGDSVILPAGTHVVEAH